MDWEATSVKPVLEDHEFRVELIRRVLAAIVEIQPKRKKDWHYGEPPLITQREV